MICSVTVTHEADPQAVSAQLGRLALQVDRMLVIDNGSANAAQVAAKASEYGAMFVPLARNAGIAAAHNVGMALARSAGCARVLLMDDDSQPGDGMVAALVRALDSTPVPAAAAAPRVVDERSGRTAPRVIRAGSRLVVQVAPPDASTAAPQQEQTVALAIASGLLVDLAAAQQVGDMRADYFIDQVDTEWCLRAGARGFAVLAVPDAVLLHRLGSGSRRVWLGRWRHVPLHSPLRGYYQWRNALLMTQQLRLSSADLCFFVLRLGGSTVLQMLAGPHRLRRLRLMLLGIRHGWQGVQGRLDEASGRCVPVTAQTPDSVQFTRP